MCAGRGGSLTQGACGRTQLVPCLRGRRSTHRASQDPPPSCVSPKAQLSFKAKRPHSPGESQIPQLLSLGLVLRFVARLLKCKVSLTPCQQLATLERGPPEPPVAGSGVSCTTHCFSPAVTHCHSLSTSCPTPRVLTRSEVAPAMQSRKPQPGVECPPLQPW